MLEGSNVQPVTQITRLIEINRAYDAIASMMSLDRPALHQRDRSGSARSPP